MHWIVCLLLLSSCAERHFSADDFQRHDNGAPKPKVAIVPVITPLDTLSEELTTCFLHRIRSTHKFYLTSDFSVLANYLTDLSEINPLVEDVRWLYENGSSSDFVVFLELVTHTLQPTTSWLFSKRLHMAVRTHVLDLRHPVPKVILQELVQETYSIPFNSLSLAHNRMMNRVSQHIQEYILLQL